MFSFAILLKASLLRYCIIYIIIIINTWQKIIIIINFTLNYTFHENHELITIFEFIMRFGIKTQITSETSRSKNGLGKTDITSKGDTFERKSPSLLTSSGILYVSRATSTGNSSIFARLERPKTIISDDLAAVSGRLPLIGRTPATGPGWPLTPATRSALSSGIVVLVASWCNTSRSFPPAETSHRLLPLYTSARNRVPHASCGATAAAVRWERNSVLSDKQLPPSGLIAAN